MKEKLQNNQLLKIAFMTIAFIIVLLSTLYTNNLARKLSVEEKKKVEIWAEATRQFILSDEEANTNFLFTIMEGNTTIPVAMTDADDNLLYHRNIDVSHKIDSVQYLQNLVGKLKSKHTPIEVVIDENTKQYIYYDDSALLKELYVFPYVQFGVIFVFIALSFFAFSSSKRAEQNRVWVGLSKETAHQLGTPISSLMAWAELLHLNYPNDGLIVDMERDINRLRIIADRFSKIGSKPDLKTQNITDVVENAINYIRQRSSQRVTIVTKTTSRNIRAHLNVPLFEWVIENLCKNAIDAMSGAGSITLKIASTNKNISIDVTDTGKGIERKKHKAVFSPGYTTKARGWGLGLSLAKRIVEEYHDGRIFVKSSGLGTGTTFRIELPNVLNDKVP